IPRQGPKSVLLVVVDGRFIAKATIGVERSVEEVFGERVELHPAMRYDLLGHVIAPFPVGWTVHSQPVNSAERFQSRAAITGSRAFLGTSVTLGSPTSFRMRGPTYVPLGWSVVTASMVDLAARRGSCAR